MISARSGWEATNALSRPDMETELNDILAAQVVVVVALRDAMDQWIDLGIAIGAGKRVIVFHQDHDLEKEEMPFFCELDEVRVFEGCHVQDHASGPMYWYEPLAEQIAAALEGEEDEGD